MKTAMTDDDLADSPHTGHNNFYYDMTPSRLTKTGRYTFY